MAAGAPWPTCCCRRSGGTTSSSCRCTVFGGIHCHGAGGLLLCFEAWLLVGSPFDKVDLMIHGPAVPHLWGNVVPWYRYAYVRMRRISTYTIRTPFTVGSHHRRNLLEHSYLIVLLGRFAISVMAGNSHNDKHCWCGPKALVCIKSPTDTRH